MTTRETVIANNIIEVGIGWDIPNGEVCVILKRDDMQSNMITRKTGINNTEDAIRLIFTTLNELKIPFTENTNKEAWYNCG